MSVIKSEFFLALNQVATERGISLEDVLQSIQEAVLAAYKKDYVTEEEDSEEESDLSVQINKSTGEYHIFQKDKDITPPNFGRIAAQTARQVILQSIRESEKREVVKHFTAQIGTIAKGRIIRFDGRNYYIDLGKTEGVLPLAERIRSEEYRLNMQIVVYIQKIEEDDYGNSRIILSRSDPKLVEALFKKEVPEIASGTVEVKGVARDAGERVKIAVFSQQSGVDPVGACVGQKGIRVKAVNDELGEAEKIDIIQYHSDPELYIREALSPAEIEKIELDEKNNRAKVTVREDQAPLAIGKNGSNVNLASELTGFEISIVQLPENDTKDGVSKESKKTSSQNKKLQKDTGEQKDTN